MGATGFSVWERQRLAGARCHEPASRLAGLGIANPLAAILSLGMALRWSLKRPDLADRLTRAVEGALAGGARTRDLGGDLGSSAMADAVLARL